DGRACRSRHQGCVLCAGRVWGHAVVAAVGGVGGRRGAPAGFEAAGWIFGHYLTASVAPGQRNREYSRTGGHSTRARAAGEPAAAVLVAGIGGARGALGGDGD